MEHEFSLHNLVISSDIKFNKNSSIESRVVSLWVDRRKDVTKLRVAFRNLANAPKRTDRCIIMSAV